MLLNSNFPPIWNNQQCWYWQTWVSFYKKKTIESFTVMKSIFDINSYFFQLIAINNHNKLVFRCQLMQTNLFVLTWVFDT